MTRVKIFVKGISVNIKSLDGVLSSLSIVRKSPAAYKKEASFLHIDNASQAVQVDIIYIIL